MDKHDIKTSAEMFLYKAIVDFTAATYLLKSFNDGQVEIDLDIIMFHLQQCAEKLLKALLSKAQVRILKIHDLGELIDLLDSNKINTIEKVDTLVALTEFAIEGRYAIIHDDLDDIDKYIVVLDELIEFVKQEIKIDN